jgi:nucleotide-binding universal stress UspA family protein
MFNYRLNIHKYIGEKMQNIKRIVIPVDDSDISKDIVKRGAFLAKLLGIDLKVISVNDTHQFMASVILEEKFKKEATAFLENFKKIGEEVGAKIETELISGNPAEEIVKYAKEDDLIIMANSCKKGFNRFFLGNLPEEVVRNAPCSVLIVK